MPDLPPAPARVSLAGLPCPSFGQLGLIASILLGVWNNLSTVINAKTLYDHGHRNFAGLVLFFLFFPGLVTSAGFLLLHCLAGRQQRGRLLGAKWPAWAIALGGLAMLVAYPLVPIGLSVYTLFSGGKHPHWAVLAKMLEGFLDDGPQFVLKLVVVVLYGIGLSTSGLDLIFTISMVTSFLSLVYFGLQFNDRRTFFLTKFFLCLPMFMAFAFARAFTLAVFVKETLDKNNWKGGVVVLAIFLLANILVFKFCGQDSIRSVVFGLCSLLIPAGFGNDTYFYQLPSQSLYGNSGRQANQSNPYEPGQSTASNPEAESGEGDGAITARSGNLAARVDEIKVDGRVLFARAQKGAESLADEGKTWLGRMADKVSNSAAKAVGHNKQSVDDGDVAVFHSRPQSQHGGGGGDLPTVGTAPSDIPITDVLDAGDSSDKPVRPDAPPPRPPPPTTTTLSNPEEPPNPAVVTPEPEPEPEMKSGLFLILYTICNAVLLSGCAVYIVATTKKLSEQSDDALVLPQMISVIPGCFLALARACLLPDLKPRCLHKNVWAPVKYCLCFVFASVGFSSVLPALFWSSLYKLSGVADGILAEED